MLIPGRCERCNAVKQLRPPSRLCHECFVIVRKEEEIESEVRRICSSWDADLALLEQFDAYAAAREAEPPPEPRRYRHLPRWLRSWLEAVPLRWDD